MDRRAFISTLAGGLLAAPLAVAEALETEGRRFHAVTFDEHGRLTVPWFGG